MRRHLAAAVVAACVVAPAQAAIYHLKGVNAALYTPEAPNTTVLDSAFEGWFEMPDTTGTFPSPATFDLHYVIAVYGKPNPVPFQDNPSFYISDGDLGCDQSCLAYHTVQGTTSRFLIQRREFVMSLFWELGTGQTPVNGTEFPLIPATDLGNGQSYAEHVLNTTYPIWFIKTGSLVVDTGVPSPVPEPSSWAAMLAGLLGVGYFARRCIA